MARRLLNRQRGFTLIELLIVVAIIGIIAALLIPNFLDALNKGRQKRSMGDIRNIGTALYAYYSDVAGAAAAGQTTARMVSISDFPTDITTVDELAAILVPGYIQEIPEFDAWGNPLEFYIGTQPQAINTALMRSLGLDGVADGDTYAIGAFAATDYNQDIVWADGGYIRRPENVQQ